MIPVVAMAAASTLAVYTNPTPQPGEPGYESVPRHYFRGMMENDSAFDLDGNYSHGTRLDYAQLMKNGDAWGLSLTQNIYTPTTHAKHAVYGEHPYAGYLALGAAYMQRGENFGNTVEFQLGTTGNASLAGEFQNALHEAAGMATWEGWPDQVPSEMTFQLSAQQSFRLPWMEWSGSNGWKTDAVFNLREEVGTAFIRGGAGITMRYGRNLPPTMGNAGNKSATFALSPIEKKDYDPSAPSYFVLGSANINYVARDITVDGGVFHHFEQTCSRVPWQADFCLGVGVSYQGIDYFAGAVYCTDSYRTQGDSTFYGTFSISWHW